MVCIQVWHTLLTTVLVHTDSTLPPVTIGASSVILAPCMHLLCKAKHHKPGQYVIGYRITQML